MELFVSNRAVKWIGLAVLVAGSVRFFLPLVSSSHTPQSSLGCAHPNFSFGAINVGDVVQHTFVVRNSTAHMLKIDSIKLSCSGCTTVAYQKFDLAPNDSTPVTLSFRTKGYRGIVSQRAVVETKPQSSPLILQLHGTVLPLIEVQSTPNLKSNTGTGSAVLIARSSRVTFKVLEVLGVEQSKITVLKPGSEYRIEVQPSYRSPSNGKYVVTLRTDCSKERTIPVVLGE